VSELQGVARFKFHEGRLEEFKHLSAQCMEIVRTTDTGTLQYESPWTEAASLPGLPFEAKRRLAGRAAQRMSSSQGDERSDTL